MNLLCKHFHSSVYTNELLYLKAYGKIIWDRDRMQRTVWIFTALICWFFLNAVPVQARFNDEQLAKMIIPPFTLGEKDPNLPVYSLLNSAAKPTGYVFQTFDLVKIAGFSGAPINLLIQMDFQGQFIQVQALEHNEPVFVNGHGGLPLDKFLDQYNDLSVAQNIKVTLSTQKADRAKNQINGVAMATASVRIINETILASALEIARKKLKGLNSRPAAQAKSDIFEKKTWQQLLDEGLIKVKSFKNSDVQDIFKGTSVIDQDGLAMNDPDGLFTKVYLADLSVPTVARNILSDENLKRLDKLLYQGATNVPILIMAEGRHRLLSDHFVPASVPEEITIRQNDLSINMRDAYVDVKLKEGLVQASEQAYVFFLDRRFGFDPAAAWDLQMNVTRKKGSFQPIVVKKHLIAGYHSPERFYEYPVADLRSDDAPPWLGSWQAQILNLSILGVFLIGLYYMLFARQSWMARPAQLTYLRPAILLFTLVFIGWYCQAQLSIVTVIAMVKTFALSPDFSFLLYDPLSTIVWVAVLISLFIWGRGTFCGWLCPYGAGQEFSSKLGGWLGIKPIRVPYKVDQVLKYVKYVVLGAIILTAIFWPSQAEVIAEVEPFKTAITLYFWRDWPFVLYAVMWLVVSMFVFKAFCRYLCPLGAFLSLGGLVRIPNWVPRRKDCGSPCQLCSVRCSYQSIEPAGEVKYSECFQCLECVSIYDDKTVCVPLVLDQKKSSRDTTAPRPMFDQTEKEPA